MSLRRLIKICAASLIIVSVILAAEGIYFYRILLKNSFPEKTDCIVILPEATYRLIAGGRLAREGYAPNITIIGQDRPSFRLLAEKFDFPETVNTIISGKSRSTFEDTLNTIRVSKKHHFDSILLVTSRYHLPRTSFLLRMLMTEPATKVILYGVSRQDAFALDQPSPSTDRKIIFNEMVKFWGSILEFTIYKITGNLLADSPAYVRLKHFTGSRILF